MSTGDLRRVQLPVRSNPPWITLAVLSVGLLLAGLQALAFGLGFQGPLHSLISDYVATPKSATVSWVGLGVALVGLSNRHRLAAVTVAAAFDIVFAVERLLRGGVLTVGNGPLIVLTGLALMYWRRPRSVERGTVLRGIALGFLLVIATKVGDTWLRITAIVRPAVLDEYALLADHALAQPSWLMGRLVEAGGPAVSGVLHWVYIELPVAALVVALYQLRHVRSGAWPRHFLIRTFLVLGLIGPVIYVVFPLVGPDFAFGVAGQGFQVGDYWPHVLPPVELSPVPIVFDDSTARNCMPSMHTAWALAVFIHSRGGPRWLRAGGTFWLVGTLSATLGFGYHYGVDLVAGALLCVTVESALREPVSGRERTRLWLVGSGGAFLVTLLVCCRYAAATIVEYPVLFGPVIVGAVALYCTAFATTFFGRPFFGALATRSGSTGNVDRLSRAERRIVVE